MPTRFPYTTLFRSLCRTRFDDADLGSLWGVDRIGDDRLGAALAGPSHPATRCAAYRCVPTGVASCDRDRDCRSDDMNECHDQLAPLTQSRHVGAKLSMFFERIKECGLLVILQFAQ